MAQASDSVNKKGGNMLELIAAYKRAKHEEFRAKERRIELGDQIAEKLDHPDEGQKSHKVGNHTVTVKGVVNRKIDWTLFDEIAKRHPELHAPVKHEPKLDVKGLSYWRKEDPNYHRELCESITATPGRVQITVKEKSK